MEDRIEETANASLNDFINNKVPVPPTAEPQPISTPSVASNPEAVSVEAPIPSQANKQPSMIKPEDVNINMSDDFDGSKMKLDEDDIEEIQYGDKKIKVSKKQYVIKSVSVQKDLVRSKIASGDIIVSRNGLKRWVSTRMEITYEDSDLKSSLPHLKWFINEPNDKGKRDLKPSMHLYDTEKEYEGAYVTVVEKLYLKFCKQFNMRLKSFGVIKFMELLKGKKVQLRQIDSEDQNGKKYSRLEIHKFV